MMIDILSQIVEFRNNESGMHVRNISTLTGMLLEKLFKRRTSIIFHGRNVFI